MSSRIFQSVIIQMKDATDRVIGVADNQGFVVATGIPHLKLVLETQRSCKPGFRKLFIISFFL